MAYAPVQRPLATRSAHVLCPVIMCQVPGSGSSAHMAIDHIGDRFGRLLVIGGPKNIVRASGTKQRLWLCRCDCGNERWLTGGELRAGLTKSCGCLHRKHGHCGSNATRSPEYNSWASMSQRCNDPGHTAYNRYGGRGIRVCEKWSSFEAFLADMGRRPSAQHTLDRYPNPNGNYEPGNCRWATKSEQARNRRTTRVWDFRGEKLCVTAIAERTGVSRQRLMARLKRGMSTEDAVSELLRAHGIHRP